MSGATEKTILLCDLSGSMDAFVGESGKTRRNMLESALANLLPRHPGVIVYAFGSDVQRVYEPQQGLPPVLGSTDLAKALRALHVEQPKHVVVISDGEPNNPDDAIRAALALVSRFSTVYCGDESNAAAIAFLKKLTLCSRGGLIGRASATSLAAPEEATKAIEQTLMIGHTPGGQARP
jgi:hypothetical protein